MQGGRGEMEEEWKSRRWRRDQCKKYLGREHSKRLIEMLGKNDLKGDLRGQSQVSLPWNKNYQWLGMRVFYRNFSCPISMQPLWLFRGPTEKSLMFWPVALENQALCGSDSPEQPRCLIGKLLPISYRPGGKVSQGFLGQVWQICQAHFVFLKRLLKECLVMVEHCEHGGNTVRFGIIVL